MKEKVKTNEKSEKQMLLNIPVTNKGDSFAVSAVPYFTQIYDLKGNIASEGKEDTRDEYAGEKKNLSNHFFILSSRNTLLKRKKKWFI